MENLRIKLNFYKIISYLVDKERPTLPSPLKSRGHSLVGNKKRKCACAHMRSRGAGCPGTPGE